MNMYTHRTFLKCLITLISIALSLNATTLTYAATGNTFMYADLRVDYYSVANARDYTTNIWVGGQPGNGGNVDFTTAWLGVHLAQSNGTAYSGKFTQIGIKTTKFGVRWFVYTEVDMTCLQGTKITYPAGDPTSECDGDYGSRVKTAAWHKVELVTYGQGFWIARLWDFNGNAVDVAKINDPGQKIFRAGSVTEEGYVLPNPHILASFWHHHPRYMQWGTGFIDWPASTFGGASEKNTFFTSPSAECPTYYIGSLNWSGDPRFWYAGSNGLPATCFNIAIF